MSPLNETKRHRILDAARQICSQNGYEAARMDDIAHVAGVSKGTLYNFFESKESLLIATVLATHEDFVVVLPAVSDPNLDPRLRLEALIESLADGFDGITQHIVLSHLTWSAVLTSPSGRQQLLATLRSIYSGYDQQLQSILEAGIQTGVLKPELDVPVVAANWIAIYDGLLYRAGFEDDEPNPAYTPAGVRRSLGWLTEQLLNPGSARQEKFALEKGTVRP